MAFTIYTQSKIAKEWQNFINDATKYFKKIEEIANKPTITKEEKEKVRIMLEIIMDEYKTLKDSPLIPQELKEKAKKLYLKAKEIYEKVFGKRDKKVS